MIDKTKELVSTIKLINDKLHFIGMVENNEPISIDYISPLGDDLGYTSLELLLLSLSSCLGSAVLTFLRRMNKKINKFEIHAQGIRREEHPTGFKNIILNMQIEAKDITNEEIQKVIDLAEEKYCPVWSMIKGNAKIEIKYQII